mmetsp:Transcript_474/g.764  ORF Transcript_474/g.764 Transcript_474/m.764 type:complete len:496 (+) Transcript_474:182-1669(+)
MSCQGEQTVFRKITLPRNQDFFRDSPVEKVEDQRIHVEEEPNARKALHFPWEEQSQQSYGSQAETQEVDYAAYSQVQERDRPVYVLQDVYGFDTIPLKGFSEGERFLIGRDRQNDFVVHNKHVSREHCVLFYQDDDLHLQPELKSCWVETKTGKWQEIKPREKWRLPLGSSFRLLEASKKSVCHEIPKIQFCVSQQMNSIPKHIDPQYLGLLRTIERNGKEQTNKKGSNKTLPQPYTMEIDLSSDDPDKIVLPIVSLRKIWHQGSKIEALWYLRGEDHIKFLQANKCSFWDAQARGESFVGLNYGLLTNVPLRDGTSFNQLETNVIDKLVAGKSSRNMCCSMSNPNEKTEQEACTSSIQFAASDGRLDLTVTQRSSDVILGLPHDVIVWSIISHLVRREVNRRSKGKIRLRAGTLYFTISAGGAHVYKLNEASCMELLSREPIPNVQPHLVIHGEDEGIFEIAQKYTTNGMTQLRVAGYSNKDAYHPSMKIDQAI